MQQNSCIPTYGMQYPRVALGAVLLVLAVGLAGQSTLATYIANIFDVRVAALISAASMVILAGLWRAAPATEGGRWSLHGTVALVVAINWAAWVVALWWH